MHLVHTQIDLSEALGLIQVSGSQSADFLQGQLSCDIQALTPSQSQLGVHCNAKGRVLFSFRIFHQDAGFYLLLPASMVSFALDDLKKYALFYDVQLQAVTHLWHIVGLSGHGLEQPLAECLGQASLPPNQLYDYQDTLVLTLPGVLFRVIILQLNTHTQNTIVPIQATAALNDWYYWDIQSGIASIDPTTRVLFTPHHIHYHMNGGVSFTKGCYTGQEVIARMQYLGKLKNQLYRITMPTPKELTSDLSIIDKDNRPQGTIVMGATSPNHAPTYHALASLNTTAITQPLWVYNTRITQIDTI